MSDSSMANEIAAYAAAVRSALTDLPASEADVLLEDLEDHLAEVGAEGEGSLADRLGPPEQYAQELRAAYGGQMSMRAARTSPRQAVRRTLEWVRATRFYRELRAFLPQLRPAWWVLRAYLAVLIVTLALSPGYPLGPLPNLGTKRGLAELAASAVAIWLSIRLGQRRRALPKLGGLVAVASNVLIAIIALPLLAGMANGPLVDVMSQGLQTQQSFGTAFSAGQVTNIYPYSKDGQPLNDVLLYDQDGRPLTLPSQGPDPIAQYPMGADGQPITNAYPLNERHPDGSSVAPPRVAIPPWPSPTPTSSPTASTSPTPSPSPTH